MSVAINSKKKLNARKIFLRFDVDGDGELNHEVALSLSLSHLFLPSSHPPPSLRTPSQHKSNTF